MKVRARRFSLFATVMLIGVTFGAPRSFAVSRSTASVASSASPIEYTLLPDGSWTAIDIRNTFAGPPVNSAVPIVDPQTGLQNAYGVMPSAPGSSADLVEYTRLSSGNWISLDLNATFGGPWPFGVARPFVDPFTNLQNVYASDGIDLIEYTRLTAGNWVSLDITRAFNLPPSTGPIPFVDPVTGFQNAYAVSGTGGLIEYTRLSTGVWVAVDITRAFGTSGLDNSGAFVPFTDPATNNQLVFGLAGGHDTVWKRNANGTWVSKDLSALFHLATGPQSLRPVVDPALNTVKLFATVGDHVFEFARAVDLTWSQTDLTATFSLLPSGFETVPFTGGGLLKLFTFNNSGDFVVHKRAADGTWTSVDLTTKFHVPALLSRPSIFLIGDPVTHLLNVYGDQPGVA